MENTRGEPERSPDRSHQGRQRSRLSRHGILWCYPMLLMLSILDGFVLKFSYGYNFVIIRIIFYDILRFKLLVLVTVSSLTVSYILMSWDGRSLNCLKNSLYFKYTCYVCAGNQCKLHTAFGYYFKYTWLMFVQWSVPIHYQFVIEMSIWKPSYSFDRYALCSLDKYL
jgi:hypothetical protein